METTSAVTADGLGRVPLLRGAPGRPALGTVFGRTLRDSRLAVGLVGALVATFVGAGGVAMVTTYGTAKARAELGQMSAMLPDMLRGLYGNPVRVDTLGGFISWHYGAYLALLIGLWSIVALSSTLAGEARRGSLDVTLSAAVSRRRVAAEKILGHLAGMALVALVIAVAAWLTGVVGARFPGDEIAPSAAAGFALGLVLKGLIAGSLAFALAELVGRGTAAALAGGVMVGGYLIQGYRSVVPAFEQLAPLSWFAWSADHLPLAGQTDWPAIAAIGLACAALLAAGTWLFVRRDIGVDAPASRVRWPAVVVGVGGPLRRGLGELLPPTFAWGVGLGLYGLVMAASARAFTELITTAPDMAIVLRRLLPDVDLTTVAGFVQYAFSELGFLLVGLAAANLVAVRHGDESSGRLELQLAAPLGRARWTIAGALALWLATAAVTALFGAAMGVGIASGGTDPGTPVAGMLALGLYAAALVGIGVGVGGLVGPSAAAPVTFGLALGNFLADVLAPILNAPDWVEQLALTSHLGRPMIGDWDWAGMLACALIALGGLALGTWGMRRRDVQG